MLEKIPHIENIAFNGWTGMLIMFIVLGYLLSLGMSGRQYYKRLSSLGKQRRRMVNYSDEVLDWRTDLVLAVSVLMSISMGMFSLGIKFGWLRLSVVNYMIIVGFAVVFLAVKYGIAKIVGYVFDISIYVPDVKMRAVYVIFGVLMLFLSMVIACDTSMTVSMILLGIIVALGLIAEIVILVENFFVKIDSLFYIFLYLCAAEILPLTVGFSIVNQVLN